MLLPSSLSVISKAGRLVAWKSELPIGAMAALRSDRELQALKFREQQVKDWPTLPITQRFDLSHAQTIALCLRLDAVQTLESRQNSSGPWVTVEPVSCFKRPTSDAKPVEDGKIIPGDWVGSGRAIKCDETMPVRNQAGPHAWGAIT
jgi:hypothetical protein